ncbi:MAG: ABC transporter ATP-binding protein [Thermodesulfobacteriota bacterium]|nr:ABC transporter ATP-binding protein [Thermodesulfobacteriota bacterium]
MYAIQTENLTKEFHTLFSKKRALVVDDINLEIDRGEIVGLLGPNGAGKSTIIKMLCGLLKPTTGKIFINGRQMENDRSRILALIGAVLEGSRNSIWSMTVKQNLTYFAHLKNVYGRAFRERGDELLNSFELEDKRNEMVKNLSKGMKQKLAIVLAFINDPDVILLDEPTLGLDVHTARLVKQRIVHMAKRNNKTVLLTTHRIEIVEEICERVAIINKGRLIAFEETEGLLSSFGGEYYIIKLSGRPDTAILEGLSIVRDVELDQSAEGEFILRLILDRKDHLFKVLEALGQGNQSRVLAINRSKPKLEDVFVKMVES